MQRRLLLIFLFAVTLTCRLDAEVRDFRVDEDRIWLTAEQEPLSRLLEHFVHAGIRVEIDPTVQKTVSGTWSNHDLSGVMDSILSDNNYLLDWERESTPLGATLRLTRIRIFPDGQAGSAQPLKWIRRIDSSPDGSIRYIARELLIGFGPNADMDTLKALLARLGGTIMATHPDLGVYRILLPPGANVPALAETLGRETSIALAEPNYVYDLPDLLPGESSGSTAQRAWQSPTESDAIAVSVLDSGLILSDELDPAILSAFDATNPGVPLTSDAVGHGTTMAQLAAGVLDPYGSPIGEGVPVVAIKAFADDGMSDSFTLMNAITYAVKNSEGPISLSWGSETPSPFIEAAMNYATSQGRLIFAAVGNEPSGIPMYPAAYPNVIGIAASDGSNLAPYSNRGDFVDLVVPGSAGGSQGTSVSTAAASHIAAKYQRLHPEATPNDIFNALKKAADPTGFLSADAISNLLER